MPLLSALQSSRSPPSFGGTRMNFPSQFGGMRSSVTTRPSPSLKGHAAPIVRMKSPSPTFTRAWKTGRLPRGLSLSGIAMTSGVGIAAHAGVVAVAVTDQESAGFPR